VYFVVPVLNEAPSMPRFFDGLRAAAGEHSDRETHVILVDDGSSDGTAAAAQAAAGGLALTTLVHERNRGPGYAFGTAFEHLAGIVGEDDFVVTLEGDNTSRTELIGTMFKRAGEERHDAIFASPYMYGGGILHTRTSRVLMSHVANTFVKELLGLHGLLTVSSFFRLYRGSTLLRLQRCYGPRVIERNGFESMVEVAMKMTYLHLSISEVPMVLDTSLRIGRSKMKVSRTALGYLALALKKREWQSQAAA
jgi:glycosyltransferase involved in cell wall biosynthesis